MFKVEGLAKGSGEVVFVDHSPIKKVFKVGSLAKGSGELVFVDHF